MWRARTIGFLLFASSPIFHSCSVEELASSSEGQTNGMSVDEDMKTFSASGYYEVSYLGVAPYPDPYRRLFGSALFYPMASSTANGFVTECADEKVGSSLNEAMEIKGDTLIEVSDLYLIEKSSFDKPFVFNEQGMESAPDVVHDETRTGVYGAWVTVEGKLLSATGKRSTLVINDYRVSPCKTALLTRGCARPKLGDLCFEKNGTMSDISSKQSSLILKSTSDPYPLTITKDGDELTISLNLDDSQTKALNQTFNPAYSYFDHDLLEKTHLRKVLFRERDEAVEWKLEEADPNWISPQGGSLDRGDTREVESFGLSLFSESKEGTFHVWGRPFVFCNRPDGQYSGPCVR